MSSLQQLRDTLPEGSIDHSVLWTMSKGDEKPHQVDSLDTSRPCVFFFGGGAYLCTGGEGVPSQRKAMQEVLGETLPSSSYNFYTMTSDLTANGDKKESIFKAGQINQVYNDHPRNFYSKEAESFVEKYIAPLAVDLKSVDEVNRKQAVEITARHFSAITMLGFSYGTTFVQEVSNALADDLGSKGYTDKEKAKVMKSLAAVNIGPTFKYTNKYPDIAQTTLVLGNDKDAVRYSGIHPSNPDLDFTHTRHGLVYSENDTHTLVYTDKDSSRLRGLSYPNPPLPDVRLHQLPDLLASGEFEAMTQDSPPAVMNRVVVPHNKQLQTASFRVDVDPGAVYYTIPSNLVGLNAVRFLQKAVKASGQSLREDKPRDTVEVNKGCVAEHFSDNALQGDTSHIFFFQRIFEQESAKGAPQSR